MSRRKEKYTSVNFDYSILPSWPKDVDLIDNYFSIHTESLATSLKSKDSSKKISTFTESESQPFMANPRKNAENKTQNQDQNKFTRVSI